MLFLSVSLPYLEEKWQPRHFSELLDIFILEIWGNDERSFGTLGETSFVQADCASQKMDTGCPEIDGPLARVTFCPKPTHCFHGNGILPGTASVNKEPYAKTDC